MGGVAESLPSSEEREELNAHHLGEGTREGLRTNLSTKPELSSEHEFIPQPHLCARQEPKDGAESPAVGAWVPGLPLPRASGVGCPLLKGSKDRVWAGWCLSPRLQVAVELLSLGLQALGFLLNEVSQDFAHLHLRGRTGAGVQPWGAGPRGPGRRGHR